MNRKSTYRTVDVTEQILFCQNGIHHSSKNKKAGDHPFISEQVHSSTEVLMVDIVSNAYPYDTSAFELHAIQQCCVVSIISPHAFTIQLTRDLPECEDFFKSMNDYYNSINDLQIPPEHIRKNLLCVTYDESIDAWNRSQIMEYDLDDDTVNVFFVDLNSWEENVSRSRLRFILTKYSSRPVCLLTCRLASIASLTDSHQWDEVSSNTFQNVIDKCRCDVEPLYQRCDQMFYVNLFAAHDEAYVCMNDFLIHCKMAQPAQDNPIEESSICMLDDDGRPLHSMIALYWKAGETTPERGSSVHKQEDEHHSTVSTESSPTKTSLLTKVIVIDKNNTLVFARYQSYIMLPWFTISSLLDESDEEKIQKLAKQFGFKPVTIDPLSHPVLCSQLLKAARSRSISTTISLYSIDCLRRVFQALHYHRIKVLDLLNRARFAEAIADTTFWDGPCETSSVKTTNGCSKLSPIFDHAT